MELCDDVEFKRGVMLLGERRDEDFPNPKLQAQSFDAAGRTGRYIRVTAAKLAPRWGRLHLKWGEALAKLGKADEAGAKWRAAATMDLVPADRAELAALQGPRA